MSKPPGYPHISYYFKNRNLDFPKHAKRPWLIVGKGPTFERILSHTFIRHDYNIISINEAVSCLPDVAFFTDFVCFERSRRAMKPNQAVFMPYRPHINQAPSIDTLEELIEEYDARKFRFYSFDLCTATRDGFSRGYEGTTEIKASSNSSQAIFHILAENEVKKIRSIGIDGGFQYHPLFQREQKPESTNPNMKQFDTFKEISDKYGIDYQKV